MPVRCFLPSEDWPREIGETVISRGREGHHLARVLRVREGDTVFCFDGQGRELEGTVQQVKAGQILLRAGPTKQLPPPPWEVVLGIAIPGQGRLEEIVNSATQLGVSAIFPLLTERTVVRFTPERFERKREHLLQVAIEAAKQSSVSRLPEIRPITPWREFLPLLAQYHRVFLGALEGPYEPWRALLTPFPASTPFKLLLLIGPEGDFSPEEVRQAVGAGAHRIGLGPSTLRCETAVTAALSVLFFLLREE